MNAEPQDQHRWLQRLVGEWTFESEGLMGPDQPPVKGVGTEVVRSLGGLWTIGEGEAPMPDGSPMKTVMTLGFDPALGRFVGTFVGSTMSMLWTYSGALDAGSKALALEAEGPSFTGEGAAKYVDSIEFLDDDNRTLTSKVQMPDGNWVQFMTAHYRRKR